MCRNGKFLKDWLRILEVREVELQRFIERPYIQASPDLWFYLALLQDNRKLQVIAQDKLN